MTVPEGDGGRGLDPAGTERLHQVLGEARDLGLLGPGPIGPQVDHALGFLRAVEWSRSFLPDGSGTSSQTEGAGSARDGYSRVLDLGAGGGLPGLVLLACWPGASVTLLDASRRRAEFLERAVRRLGAGARAQVVNDRAEVTGRDECFRDRYEVVVARSFGGPGLTAECAAPFLRVGGIMVVSEPPSREVSDQRWPAGGLRRLGMGPAVLYEGEHLYRVVPQVAQCPDRYPRRVGIPAKRPLF